MDLLGLSMATGNQPIGATMNNMRFFFSRLCRTAIPCRPAVALVALVALAWSSLAFCGEIHDAAGDGSLRKVKALLKDNPDLVSSRDNNGDTPLHLAAAKGYKDVTQLLLAKAADVNAKNNDGWTPLHESAVNGYKDVAQLLLAKGADVNAKNKDGFTPLHDAAAKGHKDVAQLLRQHGGHE
jgi:ankyrin repeat protein